MVSGGNSNHIHVGSMRCSFDFEGHARASICGTGKSIVPTFFLFAVKSILLTF